MLGVDLAGLSEFLIVTTQLLPPNEQAYVLASGHDDWETKSEIETKRLYTNIMFFCI